MAGEPTPGSGPLAPDLPANSPLVGSQMPRLWLDYCQFLMDQGRVTHTRRTFDRALRALPITQHSRIWPLYLRFLRSHPLPETAVRGYRRFLKVSPVGEPTSLDVRQDGGGTRGSCWGLESFLS